VHIVYLVGSRHEAREKAWRICSSPAFRGSGRHPNVKRVTRRRALERTTSNDRTTYFETFPQ